MAVMLNWSLWASILKPQQTQLQQTTHSHLSVQSKLVGLKCTVSGHEKQQFQSVGVPVENIKYSKLCCPYSSRLNAALLIRHPIGHTGKVALEHEEETHYSSCDQRQTAL